MRCTNIDTTCRYGTFACTGDLPTSRKGFYGHCNDLGVRNVPQFHIRIYAGLQQGVGFFYPSSMHNSKLIGASYLVPGLLFCLNLIFDISHFEFYVTSGTFTCEAISL